MVLINSAFGVFLILKHVIIIVLFHLQGKIEFRLAERKPSYKIKGYPIIS